MMQKFGLEDLSHVQSRRNLLKYLVRVEMASDWFTKIYRSILAEEINIQNRDMACKLGCGLFLSPQLLDSVFGISRIIKVSVRLISLSLRFRLTLADNPYLVLDCSGYHKNLIQ